MCRAVAEYPYVWTWRDRDLGATLHPALRGIKAPWFGDGVDRTGRRCRVIGRGSMNGALLEFDDGYQVLTSRGGLRRRKQMTQPTPRPCGCTDAEPCAQHWQALSREERLAHRRGTRGRGRGKGAASDEGAQ